MSDPTEHLQNVVDTPKRSDRPDANPHAQGESKEDDDDDNFFNADANAKDNASDEASDEANDNDNVNDEANDNDNANANVAGRGVLLCVWMRSISRRHPVPSSHGLMVRDCP